MEGVIISLAVLIFLAHLFSAMFVKTGVPEVLPLMLLGILIGPILNIVQPSDFGMVDQVFTRILLIIILFDSGLGLRVSQIRSSWAQGSRITILSYVVVMGILTVLAKMVLGLNWVYAMIVGSVLADNSFAIIIPLISKLSITNETKTVLLVESTLGGVIAIVVTVTLLGMAKANFFDPSLIAAKILYTFFIAFIVGSAAAIFWTTILNKVRKLENGIFLTLAFVFVVYSLCESLGSDGAIGAFVFGIIAGNIRTIRRITGFKFIEHFTQNVKSKSFNDVEKSFFSEILFVLRTFFFVYIGISMQITSSFAMLCGLLFTLVNFVVRIPAANYALEKHIPANDVAVASAMIPKGLVTAVLASLIAQSGITGGAIVQDVLYASIMFSILFATTFAAMAERGYINKPAAFLFSRHKKAEEPQK